jgi:hypothetical protein
VNAVMNFRVPSNAANFVTSCKPCRFSWRTAAWSRHTQYWHVNWRNTTCMLLHVV